MDRLSVAVLVAVVFLCPGERSSMAVALAGPPEQAAEDACPPGRMWRIGKYEIHLRGGPSKSDACPLDQQFVVTRNGRVVIELEESRISLDDWMNGRRKDSMPYPAVGMNVTGGRNPQVLVTGFSGGAHCCEWAAVVDLGPKPKVIDIPGGGDYPIYLKIVAGEPAPIAVTYDSIYTFWDTGYADSPAPRLLFRFRNDRYVLATDLMRKSAPSARKLERLAAELRAGDRWREGSSGAPPELWQRALDLIYSGNMAAAERLYDLAWREDRAGKEEYRRIFFRCRVRRSTVWPDVAAMNNRKADPPEGKCPGAEDEG